MQQATKQLLESLPAERRAAIRVLYRFSDGCSGHFKLKEAFAVAAQDAAASGKWTVFHFFASGHGKGEHDGAGALITHKCSLEMVSERAMRELGLPRLSCAAACVWLLWRGGSNAGGNSMQSQCCQVPNQQAAVLGVYTRLAVSNSKVSQALSPCLYIPLLRIFTNLPPFHGVQARNCSCHYML